MFNTINAYLSSSKTRKILAKRPGDEGFSLIELVVVVAILAILVAVALPNFTLITHKARVNQGKNALVTALKECNVTAADTGNATYTNFTVESFNVQQLGGGPLVPATSCSVGFQIVPVTAGQYSTFVINPAGLKTCVQGAAPATGVLGCTAPNWVQ